MPIYICNSQAYSYPVYLADNSRFVREVTLATVSFDYVVLAYKHFRIVFPLRFVGISCGTEGIIYPDIGYQEQ